jgi:hypothetical protein
MKEDTIRKQKYVPFNLIACTGSHPLELHSPTSFVNVSHRVYFFAIAFPAAIIPTFKVITCMCVQHTGLKSKENTSPQWAWYSSIRGEQCTLTGWCSSNTISSHTPFVIFLLKKQELILSEEVPKIMMTSCLNENVKDGWVALAGTAKTQKREQ